MRLTFIDPGLFRTELVLEEAVRVPDGMGGFTESWTPLAVLMALIEPLAARPTIRADREESVVTHAVTIRARPDIESGMRMRRDGRVFTIVAIYDPDESGRYLVCRAREDGR